MQLLNPCYPFFLVVICCGLGSQFAVSQTDDADPVLRISLAQTDSVEGWHEFETKDGSLIYVSPEKIVGADDIESAKVQKDAHSGREGIYLRLSRSAGEKLSVASEANLKKPMAILFNGSLVSAPLIQSRIGSNVVISGEFSKAEIDEMLNALTPSPRMPNFDADELEKFSKRMDRAFENKLVSGTVLIAVDGKIVFEKSVGYANINDKTPLAENSSFRLASLGKQFTAMGIMMLKEEGKLDFDDDITEHLTSLSCKGVTIRHLLYHTGGLTDYMDLFGKHWNAKTDDGKIQTAFNSDLVNLFATHKPDPDFAPGDRYDYSNTGYVMLGSIIEAASGQTIQDFFKQHIFEPLKMKDSFAFSPDESVFKPASRVYGFAFDGDGHEDNDWNYLNGMVGDGGIYASARDLLKWDQALYTESLVSQTTIDEACTPGKLNSGKDTDYGFGWVIQRSKTDGLTVSHNGSWVGFRTSIARHVDRKFTVIVLTNNSTDHLDQVIQAIDEITP